MSYNFIISMLFIIMATPPLPPPQSMDICFGVRAINNCQEENIITFS